MYRYKYKIVVSGGTFDHFHKGHKSFLRSQLAVGEKVLIGITSDAFTAQNKEVGIEPYENRLTAVKDFLVSEHALERVEIQKIDDMYIPALWRSYPIEAIAVTNDSISGAQQINLQREKEGLSPLVIFTVPYTLAQDGKRISASRIRKGEIDRDGNLFVLPMWLTKTVCLPESLRQEIAQPLGRLIENIDDLLTENLLDPLTTISVGDVITDALVTRQFKQKVSVIDLYVQRKKVYNDVAAHHFPSNVTTIAVYNPHGIITPALFAAAQKSLFEKGNYVIVIDGEEDLAVLPFVLLAPLNFHILYGQPGRGIVLITITEKEKQKSKKILEKFTILASN